MPTSVEAFALLLLTILPGFIVVTVERQFRPLRTHTQIDGVVWYALYSLIINAAMILSTAFILAYCFHFDPAPLVDKGLREFVRAKLKADMIAVIVFAISYLVASGVLSLILGYCIARITSQLTPVWWLETVQRTSSWSWFAPRRLRDFR